MSLQTCPTLAFMHPSGGVRGKDLRLFIRKKIFMEHHISEDKQFFGMNIKTLYAFFPMA